MIRLVIVDDHPAVRSGLETVLSAEPDLVPVGTTDSANGVWPLLQTTRPDLVVLDYHLPGQDGLQVCRRIKGEALAPRVLLYSAYASSELAIPAALAGADGVIGKNSRPRELVEAIRSVAEGELALPPVPQELYEGAARRIDERDLPILGMLIERTPVHEVQQVLGIERSELAHRIDAMIGRLRVDVPQLAVSWPS